MLTAGIDGYINFFDDTSGKPKRIVVQVKEWQCATQSDSYTQERHGTRKSLAGPLRNSQATQRPMEQEALEAGFYVPGGFPDHQFRRCRSSPSRT